MKMIIVLFLTLFSINCRANDVDWGQIIDQCFNNSSGNNQYCREWYERKVSIEQNFNNLFLQNLSPIEKYMATGTYYLITRRINFPFSVDGYKFNLAYRFAAIDDHSLTLSYSF